MKGICVLALSLCLASASHAQVISGWTFESILAAPGSPGAGIWLTNVPAEIGIGTASALHAGNAAYSIPSGNGSPKSLSVNTWSVGDLFQFSVSTMGYTAIGLSWDQGSSQTGPGRFDLSYSTDGISFTPFASS